MLAKIAKKGIDGAISLPDYHLRELLGRTKKITHTPCCLTPNYQMKNILGENYYCQTFAPPVTECLERH